MQVPFNFLPLLTSQTCLLIISKTCLGGFDFLLCPTPPPHDRLHAPARIGTISISQFSTNPILLSKFQAHLPPPMKADSVGSSGARLKAVLNIFSNSKRPWCKDYIDSALKIGQIETLNSLKTVRWLPQLVSKGEKVKTPCKLFKYTYDCKWLSFQSLMYLWACFMPDNNLHHVQNLNLPYKVSVITHNFKVMRILRPKVIHQESGWHEIKNRASGCGLL